MTSFKVEWLKEQFTRLRNNPALKDYSNEDLKKFLLEKYEERYLAEGRFFNNATHENEIMNQEQFINRYLQGDQILSGYACLFNNQDNALNVPARALEMLGDLRKFYKKKMEASVHGTEEYIYYRILQLTYKILMNSFYGILGEKNSIFYNPFVQNSITMTGQDLITTSIIGMEMFLGNNTLFEDTDDAIRFIFNVANETKRFSILDYVDKAISKEELYNYLMSHVKNGQKIDIQIIKDYISMLNPELCTRCYYKNRMMDLINDNEWFRNKLADVLKYKYAEEPDEEMKPILNDLKEKLLDFCWYNYLYEDRYKRAVKDKRKTIIAVDTDSNFINIDPYVKNTTKLLGLDQDNEEQQMTIMNVFINITTDALKKLFWLLTDNMNVIDSAKPIINMKSEFVYKRIMLTNAKKNYAGIIVGELGKLLDEPDIDVKGLPILKKSSVPSLLRKQFMEIVTNDILKPSKMNLKEIMRKYDSVENSIRTSIANGEPYYLLPKKVQVLSSYKTPDRIEAVRGILTWNALEPENQIIPPEKLNIIKLNCISKDDPRLLDLKKNYPEKYNAIMKTVFNVGVTNPKIDFSSFGFNTIAIPKGVAKIPEYLIPFIDMTDMINTNMIPSFILLRSLGIYVETIKTVDYKTNIIEI